MKLFLNGKEHELSGVKTLYDLLSLYKLLEKPIAVELNYKVIPRRDFSNTILQDGDKIEIVQFVGGGY
jgi:thiamine biosynthesis protein ThiS